MSGWEPGDLALCIKLGNWQYTATGDLAPDGGMRCGVIASVRRVAVSPRGNLVLWFVGYPGDEFHDGYVADRFRKITPGADIQGIEEPRRIPVKEKA